MYAALAFLLEDTLGHTVLPLGRRGGARAAIEGGLADQLDALEDEAGVRRSLRRANAAPRDSLRRRSLSGMNGFHAKVTSCRLCRSGVHTQTEGQRLLCIWTKRRRRVREADVLERIRGLAIPPAWRDVWICPVANGHLQAVGTDEAGPSTVPLPPRVARASRSLRSSTHMLRFAEASSGGCGVRSAGCSGGRRPLE